MRSELRQAFMHLTTSLRYVLALDVQYNNNSIVVGNGPRNPLPGKKPQVYRMFPKKRSVHKDLEISKL